MRQPLLAILVSGLLLAGCGQVGVGSADAPRAAELAALAAKPTVKKAHAAALARFTQQEGRKVTSKLVPMNEGRGAAELRVPLSPAEKSMLVQLYRLHAQRLDASEFPEGLLARSSEHLSVLHRFKFPDGPAWEPQRVREALKPRCYRDGDGNIIAYETWLVEDTYQIFGKYDTQGRILKIDIETWTM